MPEQPVNPFAQPQPVPLSPAGSAPVPAPPAGRAPSGSFSGSFRLFRLFGIDVYMNWTWFIVAYFQIRYHPLHYTSPAWKVAEYLSLFGIVLLHEFGHALACRQVGGVANRIVLWPLGGIAYVSPPPRPGAHLWSIAAGPLVNVVLVPVTVALWLISRRAGWGEQHPDLNYFLTVLMAVNISLLIFNMLPIYPLDGGQIVRSLLWFVIGPARSLMVVSVIGVLAGVSALAVTLAFQNWWLMVLAIFAVFRSVTGFQLSRGMLRQLNAPRHEGFACPSCGTAPPRGELWTCGRCQRRFDTFVHQAVCPGCGASFIATQCLNCGGRYPIGNWISGLRAPGPGTASNPTTL